MKIEDLCLKDLRKFAKTAGIKNVSKSKKKLLAELKDRQIGGGIPKEPVIFQATKESYSNLAPDKLLEGFDKILESPTLDAYLRESDKSILIGVRGTEPTSPKDLAADAVLIMNGLRRTTRYKNDKEKMEDIIEAYPPSEYDYTLGGHSLAGAITKQFKRDYPFIKKIVQYNPAFQTADLTNQSGDKGVIKRYYLENDFLYNLGGRFFKNNIVLPSSEKQATSFFGKLRKMLPTSKIMSGLKGHKLENFNQLYTEFDKSAAMNPKNQVDVKRSKMPLKKPSITMEVEDEVKLVDNADEIESKQDPKPITTADQVNVIIRKAKEQRAKKSKSGFISNLVSRTRGLFGRGGSKSKEVSCRELVKRIKEELTGSGTLLSRAGNKRTMLCDIYKLMPEDIDCFVDVFTGSGVVALSLSDYENFKEIVMNDKDKDVYKLLTTVKNLTEKDLDLIEELGQKLGHLLPNKNQTSEQLKTNGRKIYEILDQKKGKVYDFLKKLILMKGGFGGRVAKDKNDIYKVGQKVFNRKTIEEMRDRLRTNVKITNQDFKQVINKYKNRKDCFIYLDPPYFYKDDRNVGYYNKLEDKNIDFEELKRLLDSAKCKWLLSINDDKYIRDLFKNYNIKPISVISMSGNVKDMGGKRDKKRQELLIYNY